MNKIITGVIIAAGAACAAVIGFAAFFMENVMHGRRQTPEEAMEWQRSHYDTGWYDAYEKENYTVRSYDGYELHATLVRNPAGTDRYVILTHGYTDTRFGMLKYMKIYLDLGFHCVIYDIRDHGENKRTFCTYSVREARDLTAVAEDARERFGRDISIGLHGESLGAATTARSLMYGQDYSFAVCDCGFADIENVLFGALKYMHIPRAVGKISSAMAKLRYGYSFSEMTPIQALAGNRVPMLFIHGEDDSFIPPDNSRRMSEATAGYSELHLIPGAGHAKSVLTDPGLYAEIVKTFIAGRTGR